MWKEKFRWRIRVLPETLALALRGETLIRWRKDPNERRRETLNRWKEDSSEKREKLTLKEEKLTLQEGALANLALKEEEL